MCRTFFMLIFSSMLIKAMDKQAVIASVQENRIAIICTECSDPYLVLAAIEKEFSPTPQALTEFLKISQFSKHVRSLLYKMHIIAMHCSLDIESLLSKTMFTKLSTHMQKFIKLRYAATYDWGNVENKGLCEREFEYLKSRKKKVILEPALRISVFPFENAEAIQMTYDGKQLLQILNIEIKSIKSRLSKTGKCALMIASYRPIIKLTLRPLKISMLVIPFSDKIIDLLERFGSDSLLGLPKLTPETFAPKDVHTQFSPNDEFLCIVHGSSLCLIDLQEQILRTINPGLLGAMSKPVFSADATILIILLRWVDQSIEKEKQDCLVVDTFFKNKIEVRRTYPFFQKVHIMPDNHSLIFCAGIVYFLHEKAKRSSCLFTNYCTYLLGALKSSSSYTIFLSSGLYNDFRRSREPGMQRVKDRTEQIIKRNQSLKSDNNLSTNLAKTKLENSATVNEGKKNREDQCKKTYLSLDGNGMNALIVADVLAQLEHHLGKPIANYFDVITGSGFGGIIGLGTAASLDGSQSQLTAQAIYDALAQKGQYIFDKSLRGPKKPFYDTKNLRHFVRELLLSAHLSDSLTQIVLPVQIKSTIIQPFSYSRDQARMREIDDIDLAQLALYATADLKLFPSVEMHHYKGQITASKAYQNNSAQYILDELLPLSCEQAPLVLSISPQLSGEASLRTHNLLNQRLGYENYRHLHADQNSIVGKPDDYSCDLIDNYKSAVANSCTNSAVFLRRLQEIKSSKHPLALLED